jgi:hypothetical protein
MVEVSMKEAYDPDLQKESSFPLDENGLPGTIQRDGSFGGGDTASMLGIILTLCDEQLISTWKHKLDFLWNEEANRPVRHPNISKPWGRTNRFSRDQMVPILCAGVRLKSLGIEAPIFNKLFKVHKDNYFLRAWNTERNGDAALPHPGGADWTGPQIWGLWLRIYKPWWRHLFLWLFDFENLIGSLVWIYKTKTESLEELRKYRITANHMAVAYTGKHFCPTPISVLSYKLTPLTALILRWDAHARRSKEYNTADLFRKVVND